MDVYPIFDILPRLWESGHVTKQQDGVWWLFDSDGEGIISGASFRELCVNIVLAGFNAEVEMIDTERFEIHETHIERPDCTGGVARQVYLAFPKMVMGDIPRPICTVTLFGNYVEWLHVDEEYVRQGVATEVIAAIEASVGALDMEAATDAGAGFLKSLDGSGRIATDAITSCTRPWIDHI